LRLINLRSLSRDPDDRHSSRRRLRLDGRSSLRHPTRWPRALGSDQGCWRWSSAERGHRPPGRRRV